MGAGKGGSTETLAAPARSGPLAVRDERILAGSSRHPGDGRGSVAQEERRARESTRSSGLDTELSLIAFGKAGYAVAGAREDDGTREGPWHALCNPHPVYRELQTQRKEPSMDYEQGRQAGEDMMGSAKNTLEDVRHHAQEYYEQGVETARDVKRRIESDIADAPLASVSAACAIGLVLGVGIGLLIGSSMDR